MCFYQNNFTVCDQVGGHWMMGLNILLPHSCVVGRFFFLQSLQNCLWWQKVFACIFEVFFLLCWSLQFSNNNRKIVIFGSMTVGGFSILFLFAQQISKYISYSENSLNLLRYFFSSVVCVYVCVERVDVSD